MVKDQHPQAVKEALASVLPIWLDAFKVLLDIDPLQDVAQANNWDGLTVRIQIFKVYHTPATPYGTNSIVRLWMPFTPLFPAPSFHTYTAFSQPL